MYTCMQYMQFILQSVTLIDFFLTFQTVSDISGDGVDPTSHEVVTANLEIGISIKNLTKIFGLVSYFML
jgi:hypothetical protein